MSTELALSIVIPCKDDPRVLDCINSIDFPCEVLVVINGSSPDYVAQMAHELPQRGATVEVLEQANLSAALEHGVKKARNDAILFMDADCRFEPNAIGRLMSAMSEHGPENAVFKGMVCFEHGKSYLSQLISRSRHIHTAAPPTAFKPPLLVHRCLGPLIGGYFFDARLLWKEDADLDWRLRTAGIEVVSVPEARIHHAALEIVPDLRSNYRYGVGAALGKLLDIPLTTPNRSLWHTFRCDGMAVAAYMSVANLARTTGYHWTLLSAAVRGHA